MVIKKYKVSEKGLRLLLLTDLHNVRYDEIIRQSAELYPDIIAVVGDVTRGLKKYDRVEGFLAACAGIAPTFLSVGNHDRVGVLRKLNNGSAVLLNDEYIDTVIKGVNLRIGGLTAPVFCYSGKKEIMQLECGCGEKISDRRKPNTAWLNDFCNISSYKILLCHRPEYYPKYISQLPIELSLAGHAHGGQWRIPFTQQGVFATGQGFFPRLTGGVFEERVVISRGLSNTAFFPRFFNPCEIVAVEI